MSREHELQEIDFGGCHVSEEMRRQESVGTDKAVRLAAKLSREHSLRPHVAVMAACAQLGANEHSVWEVLGWRALRELGAAEQKE